MLDEHTKHDDSASKPKAQIESRQVIIPLEDALGPPSNMFIKIGEALHNASKTLGQFGN